MPALILAVCSSWQLSVLLQSEIETKIKRGSSEITPFFFFLLSSETNIGHNMVIRLSFKYNIVQVLSHLSFIIVCRKNWNVLAVIYLKNIQFYQILTSLFS